jgi:hypothetical protein
MAHYAYIDETNTVVMVIVGKEETELIDSLEPEIYYAQGTPYTVKRTSYNAAINGFRYNYAGIGYTYDSDADAFVAPRPECNHKELFLNDQFKWNCQGCELQAKKLLDET